MSSYTAIILFCVNTN